MRAFREIVGEFFKPEPGSLEYRIGLFIIGQHAGRIHGVLARVALRLSKKAVEKALDRIVHPAHAATRVLAKEVTRPGDPEEQMPATTRANLGRTNASALNRIATHSTLPSPLFDYREHHGTLMYLGPDRGWSSFAQHSGIAKQLSILTTQVV